MRIKLFLYTSILVLLAFPLTASADPVIEVSPENVEFGNVKVNTSQPGIVTISNTGGHPLVLETIALQDGTDPAFTFTAPASTFIPPPDPDGTVYSVDIGVTFTPTSTGLAEGSILITSNAPDAVVTLAGDGVPGDPPSSLSVEDILIFFDESVANLTLEGYGPGNSADGRRGALRNMIKAAGDLLDDGNLADGCQQLLDAYQRTDGLPRPPEFVTGESAPVLAGMIFDLMAKLGCE